MSLEGNLDMLGDEDFDAVSNSGIFEMCKDRTWDQCCYYTYSSNVEIDLDLVSDFDILDLCKEVAMATEEFAGEYDNDSEHSKTLFESTEKLEKSVDEVLSQLNGN